MFGDTFPGDRIPALLTMLNGFKDVEVLQAKFHNRILRLFPWDEPAQAEATIGATPATKAIIPPRRSGHLAQRLSALEEVERAAEVGREAAMRATMPVLRMWEEGLEEWAELCGNWPGVVFNSYHRTTAIPPNARRKRRASQARLSTTKLG